ncbi:MAG: trypsin-like serine protease [Actinobacteria bacterium]|nr:trypsin-like serine protease [Actinomycetota bacterium]
MRVGTVVAVTLLAVSSTGCVRGPAEHASLSTPSAPAPVTTSVPSTAGAPATASAAPVAPDSRIGAIFLGATDLHTCSASVLDTATGDLILTAAHCLVQDVDSTFVAGFDDSAADDETWRIDTVYLDPRWVADQDPLADFAIARVSRAAGDDVEAFAGGGLTIGLAPPPGTAVTVTGYGLGIGGGPIRCAAVAARAEREFPSVDCAGLVPGVSGAPWTTGARGSTVVGLVGGLDGGGCEDDVSYSPPFDAAITRLLARAEAGGPGDDPPMAADDDC